MKITRGDSKRYKFQRLNSEGEVIEEQADRVFFTAKKLPQCSKVAFQKKLGDGITFDEESFFYYIDITPEDTKGLDFGDYGFDIEVQNGENYVKTICVGKLNVGVEYTTERDK